MEIANVQLPARSLERKRGISRRLLLSTLQAYLFLLPTFALIGLFAYYPAVLALYHSLTDWNGVLVAKYVGLDNFREMLRDQVLLASLSNMLTVVVWSLIITLTVPLLVAELIYSLRNHRAQYWYRLLFVAPIVVPFVVTLLVWRFIYDPDLGLLNALLEQLGIAFQSRWLGDPNLALYCLLFIGFPFAAGTNVLIYLAGLQGIGDSVIDAAKLDGATGLRRVISIDLPLILGQVRLLAILSLIGAIQGFGAQLVLTRGGPGYATMVPGMWMYETAFSYSRMGYASAIGTSMFFVILALTLVIMRSVDSSTEYKAG
ncbi:MAG TPA: sugar ABC transporter permease [Caldilineaceae bacterium]|nr:sugar ABC transporter permease [Caldilineaceae bacterium]